jgi:glycosyltransferase involved in cell wall biosynthesis
MKISVIVSTYNWPEALVLSLESLSNQTILPNEIVIADDGSGAETLQIINSFKSQTAIPIIHCWHEDKGFRLAKIRNLAQSKCNYEYVIQIDGDVICHPEFIRDHLSYASKGVVLTGRRAELNVSDTNQSLKLSKLIFSDRAGVKPSYRTRNKLLMTFLKPAILNQYIGKGVLGCNMSYWLADALAIQGYNEKIEGWGREDEEFVARLQQIGIQKRTIRFGAIQYHLEHTKRLDDNYINNTEILKNTLKGKA